MGIVCGRVFPTGELDALGVNACAQRRYSLQLDGVVVVEDGQDPTALREGCLQEVSSAAADVADAYAPRGSQKTWWFRRHVYALRGTRMKRDVFARICARLSTLRSMHRTDDGRAAFLLTYMHVMDEFLENEDEDGDDGSAARDKSPPKAPLMSVAFADRAHEVVWEAEVTRAEGSNYAYVGYLQMEVRANSVDQALMHTQTFAERLEGLYMWCSLAGRSNETHLTASPTLKNVAAQQLYLLCDVMPSEKHMLLCVAPELLQQLLDSLNASLLHEARHVNSMCHFLTTMVARLSSDEVALRSLALEVMAALPRALSPPASTGQVDESSAAAAPLTAAAVRVLYELWLLFALHTLRPWRIVSRSEVDRRSDETPTPPPVAASEPREQRWLLQRFGAMMVVILRRNDHVQTNNNVMEVEPSPWTVQLLHLKDNVFAGIERNDACMWVYTTLCSGVTRRVKSMVAEVRDREKSALRPRGRGRGRGRRRGRGARGRRRRAQRESPEETTTALTASTTAD